MPYRIKDARGQYLVGPSMFGGWVWTRSRARAACFAIRNEAEFVRTQIPPETEIEIDKYTIADA